MIVAFFTSVSNEVSASNSYAAGVTVKQLSETATNMVIGEITDATQGYTDPTKPTGASILSWASQPGMIRTYDQSGAPYRYYKLYSAENMVMTRPPPPLTTPASNGGDPMSVEFNNDVPQNWASQIGLYTDLNAPVLVPDPTGTINAGNGTTYRADYPIVDPSASRAHSRGLAADLSRHDRGISDQYPAHRAGESSQSGSHAYLQSGAHALPLALCAQGWNGARAEQRLGR